MKILLIGKNGQVGKELVPLLKTIGSVVALGHRELDLEDPRAIAKTVDLIRPDCVINAAAYTGVDLAEVEKEKVYRINAVAPGLLAEQAQKYQALFIHYSTDYVFDGQKGSVYNENDTPNPINFYGLSKFEGETAIQSVKSTYLIFRTSYVYSLESGSSFVTKLLKQSGGQEPIKVVIDQVGNPTWCGTLAKITVHVLSKGVDVLTSKVGIYHVAGGGFASRFEWAQAVVSHTTASISILPAVTSDFPAAAVRPLFSALDCSKFERVFELKIPDWRIELDHAMAVLGRVL